MEWTTLIATLLGAAIAMVTSLGVEIRKDRHDTDAEWRRSRREIYTEYLTVLAQVRWELSGVAASDELSPETRRTTANAVFAQCYQVRHQLELFAPDDVLESALIYFRALRTFRDDVREGRRDGSPGYDRASEYAAHVRRTKEEYGRCRDSMRTDINPHRPRYGRRRGTRQSVPPVAARETPPVEP